MQQFVATGAFTRDYATERVRQRAWRFDAGLEATIRELIAGRAAFDFGAGVGRYCAAVGCRGVDGIDGIETLSGGLVAYGDLTDPELAVPPHQVAICLEVAEHIPRRREAEFLANISRCCDWLILSWAAPGQPGVGHVNCRTPAEMRALLTARGFEESADWTRRLRAAATISWLKDNVCAFQRRPPEGCVCMGSLVDTDDRAL